MDNYVHLEGTVLRDAEQVNGILEFTLCVPDHRGRNSYIDCIAVNGSDAMAQLDGFVQKDEALEVEGCLTRKTHTKVEERGGRRNRYKYTTTVVYAVNVKGEEE